MKPFRISSDSFEFLINFPDAFWGIFPNQRQFPWLVSKPITLFWHDRSGRHFWSADQEAKQVIGPKGKSDNLREVESLQLHWSSPERALEVSLEYALDKAVPALEWRLMVKNVSEHPVHLDRVIMLDTRKSHRSISQSKPSLKYHRQITRRH